MTEIVKGRYRHFKGGYYDVIEPKAIDTETGKEYVVCKSSNGTVWVRPISMWNDIVVDSSGNKVKRFTYAPNKFDVYVKDKNGDYKLLATGERKHG